VCTVGVPWPNQVRNLANHHLLQRPLLRRPASASEMTPLANKNSAFASGQKKNRKILLSPQVFYYALIAVDEAGNASPISNIVSLYVREEPTTISPPIFGKGRGNATLLSTGISSLFRGWSSGQAGKIYLAAAFGAIFVLFALVIFAVIVVRLRAAKKQRRYSEYDANDKDTYRTYEPATVVVRRQEKEKNLTSWLDSLPRSVADGGAGNTSPNTTSHDLSLDHQQQAPATLPRSGKHANGNNHTLTKTNPYRHKVLTNGSFLNLKDIPNGGGNVAVSSGVSSSSNEDSSRPTTSTEDNRSSSSQPGSESGEYQQQQRYPPSVASPNGGQVIDTSTARAIIDTYSGNLFSGAAAAVSTIGGPGYYSFRRDGVGGPIHAAGQHNRAVLRQQMAVEVGQDNLESVHRSLANYPRVVPAAYYEDAGDYSQSSSSPKVPPAVRPRTESVV